MTQPQGIFRDSQVELFASRSAPLTQQAFIASERTQPVSRRGFSAADAKLGEQISEGAEFPNREAGRGGRAFHEMQMRIDEAGNHGAPAHLQQMSARTDGRFQLGEFAVGQDGAIENRDRVAFRMPEDYALVKNQIGFIQRHRFYGSSTPPPWIQRLPKIETLAKVQSDEGSGFASLIFI